MNILVIDDEWPSEFSGKGVRVINIFKRLSTENNLYFLYIGKSPPKNVNLIKDIFSSIDYININSKVSQFGRILNVLHLKPGAYAKWKYNEKYRTIRKEIEKIVLEKHIDIIHTFSYFTAQYVPRLDNVFKTWDVGDSYYLNDKRGLKFLSFAKKLSRFIYAQRLFNYEQEMIKKFDRTVFVSSIDGGMHRNLMDRINVIPLGVDTEYFRTSGQYRENKFSLIFTGHMNFGPNVHAVLYFVKQIFPSIKKAFPQLKFYIVGAEPDREISKLHGNGGIVVTGAVSDVRPYLARATLFIAPMVSGAGVKNKVLQAMAMSKPVVSTRLGIEALNVNNNKEVIIVDGPSEFVNKTILLLQDKTLRESLGFNARLKVEKDYNWDTLILKYKTLYIDGNRERIK